MKLCKDRVILQPLTLDDAAAFYGLYQQLYREDAGVFLAGETPEVFTQRIFSQCEALFTIRLPENPHQIIGDCALHHYEAEKREIEIGGSLLPAFQGKGLMTGAFSMLLEWAAQQLDVKRVWARTTPGNKAAIRLAEKLLFKRWQESETELTLRRILNS